jgi:hypothetical protein
VFGPPQTGENAAYRPGVVLFWHWQRRQVIYLTSLAELSDTEFLYFFFFFPDRNM